VASHVTQQCPYVQLEAVRTLEPVSTADSDGACTRFGPDEGATAPMGESTSKRLLHDLPRSFSLILGIQASSGQEPIQPRDRAVR
jgi:hypothetical protein